MKRPEDSIRQPRSWSRIHTAVLWSAVAVFMLSPAAQAVANAAGASIDPVKGGYGGVTVGEPATGSIQFSSVAPSTATDELVRESNPNIIFIQADDMSKSQLRFMPETRRLIFDRGTTFANYFTNVSICCPARASLHTGRYAHNTGIVANVYPGGFYGYEEQGLSEQAFPQVLQDNGYVTALLGKFLNGYVSDPYYSGERFDPTYQSGGWSEWAVPFKGQFRGERYDININGSLLHKDAERDFLSDYLNRRATRLIRDNTDGAGLMIELSDYGPHNPAPTSPIELNDWRLQQQTAELAYPRTPAFDEADVSDKPDYIQALPRLTEEQKESIDEKWRERALSLATLDRHVGEVWRAVRRTGQLDNTYFVFTSDNGYHLGEYRMAEGKSSEYDTDVRLPLGISGPGIKPGTLNRDVVGNIDLAPTFLDMAGVEAPATMDGNSILRLLARDPSVPKREFFFIQKGFARYAQPGEVGEPATRVAERNDANVEKFIATAGRGFRYVLYDGDNSEPTIGARINGNSFQAGFEAFYDVRTDPHQVNNLAIEDVAGLTPRQQQMLSRMQAATLRLADCQGAVACNLGGSR